jgi:hypothetical protein
MSSGEFFAIFKMADQSAQSAFMKPLFFGRYRLLLGAKKIDHYDRQ